MVFVFYLFLVNMPEELRSKKIISAIESEKNKTRQNWGIKSSVGITN